MDKSLDAAELAATIGCLLMLILIGSTGVFIALLDWWSR